MDILKSTSKHIFSLDCAPIDIIIGGCGFPSGKIMEIYGWESTGKSLFALEIEKAFTKCCKASKVGYETNYIESEAVFDIARAAYIGCDVLNIHPFETDLVEEGFEFIVKKVEEYKHNKKLGLFIWDTVAATSTKNEKEKGMYGGGQSEKPRIIKSYLRRLTLSIAEANATFIALNQVNQGQGGFNPQDEPPGGGGFKFHSSVRGSINRKMPKLKAMPDGTNIEIGYVATLFTKKNKLILPRLSCDMHVYNETGLNKLETVLKALEGYKIIQGTTWKTIAGIPESVAKIQGGTQELKYQGIDKIQNVIDTLYPEVYNYLNYLVYKHYTTVSPFVKLRIMNKVWEYEEKYFEKRITTMTDKEKQVSELIALAIQKETEKEEKEAE